MAYNWPEIYMVFFIGSIFDKIKLLNLNGCHRVISIRG
jgi:hypothetical protein